MANTVCAVHGACRAAALTPRAATIRFSRTVRLLKIRRPCGTSATPRDEITSGGSRVTAAPNTSTVPARGGNSPTLTFMQVDLPAPLRPSRPRSLPSPRSNETFCSTWLSP